MAIPDFIQEALDRAPLIAEEDLDPEELAEVLRRSAAIDAGLVQCIPHEQVQQTIAALRPLAG